MHSIASPSPGRSGHVNDLQLLTAVSSLTVGCDLLLALSLIVEGPSRRCSSSRNRTSRSGEVFSIKKQDKQVWGGVLHQETGQAGRCTHTGCCCVYNSTLNGCEGVGRVSTTPDVAVRNT